MNLLSAQPQN